MAEIRSVDLPGGRRVTYSTSTSGEWVLMRPTDLDELLRRAAELADELEWNHLLDAVSRADSG